MSKLDFIRLDETTKTPSVYCDAEKGLIEISGVCIVEDVIKFFEPVKNWIVDYKNNPKDTTLVNVELEYFNTSTSLVLLNIFRLLANIKNENRSVQFRWIYDEEDEDMMEAGMEYKLMVEGDFQLEPKVE